MRFFKYEANGNDFVLLPLAARGAVEALRPRIAQFCDRKRGVGSDGVLFFLREACHDFSVFYYNADGSQAFCANGMRASLLHAHRIGLDKTHYRFTANDGEVLSGSCQGEARSTVSLPVVSSVVPMEPGYFVQVGCPHYVQSVEDLAHYPVESAGRRLRHDERFPEGANVNFWQRRDDKLFLRSYERGVEAETLSCGTGVVATVLAYHHATGQVLSHVETSGGRLEVSFTCEEGGVYEGIRLGGSVRCVYEGRAFF